MRPNRLCVLAVACVAVTATVAVGESTLLKREAARSLLRSNEPAKAAPLYLELAEANPTNGAYWEAYASASHSAGNYTESARGWMKAAELGFFAKTNMYNVACAFAKMGKTDKALDWLERAYEAGFVNQRLVEQDGDLDSLRKTDRFRVLTGIGLSENRSRAERWRTDIDFLARRMEEVHWDLYRVIPEEEFAREMTRLKARVEGLEDHEIWVELRRVVARVGDGHTSVFTSHDGVDFGKGYTVAYYMFPDGIYIRGASEASRDIVGGKVVRMGDTSADDVVAKITPLVSRDNDQWIKQIVPDFLRNADVLHALGIADSRKALDVTIEQDGKTRTVRLQAVPWEQSRDLVWGSELAGGEKPLYLRDTKTHYWFEHLKEYDLVYFQYNAVLNMDGGETIAEFAERMFEYVRDNDVRYMVVDLRHNHGGNSFLNPPILYGLVTSPVNQDGRLFTIVGRQTFSAAQNFTSDLDFNTHTLFVGEPTGSRPNFVGETSVIVLPYSRFGVSCSSRYHQHSHSNDQRVWIPPDITAEPTWETYSDNRDPAMEAILGEIRALAAAQHEDPGQSRSDAD